VLATYFPQAFVEEFQLIQAVGAVFVASAENANQFKKCLRTAEPGKTIDQLLLSLLHKSSSRDTCSLLKFMEVFRLVRDVI